MADQPMSRSYGAQIDDAPRPLSVDCSGLRVYRTPLAVLVGRAGYRPFLLLFASVLLAFVALAPVPGSLIDLVEMVNPPGYDMMGFTETIVDSVNYHENPEAFEAGKASVGSVVAADGLDTGEQVARRALIMVGILLIAALFWATEALPIAGTVTLVAALIYVFGILPSDEVPKAFMGDAVFFILGVLAIAVGVSKTGLDKRIGLFLLSPIRSTGLFAFIFIPVLAVSAGFISAHAIVALLVPVMIGIYKATCTVHGVKQDKALAVFLLLSLSFAANAGGPGSPAAGARNAIMVGYLADAGFPIGFGEWMKFSLPLVPVLALTVGIYMYIRLKPKFVVPGIDPSEIVKREFENLSGFSKEEAIMTTILALLVMTWIIFDDSLGLGGATVTAVFAMFLFRIISWDDIRDGVALDVVGLYAAASAMAVGLAYTGAALWIAYGFVDILPGFMGEGNGLLLGVSIITTTLTNFMSDGAAVGALGPITLPMAQLGDVSIWKVGLMVSYASSFANVLIVGTPNNAIVFAMGRDPETGERLLSAFDFINYGLPLTLLMLVVTWGWSLFGYWTVLSWP